MSEQKIKSEDKKEKKIFYRKIETEGIFISFDILSAGFVKFFIFLGGLWPFSYIWTIFILGVLYL